MIPSVLPTYSRAPMSFVKGEGSWLIEADGRRFLDLGAGIAVNALGHAHPTLVAALTDQANALWHVSNLYQIPQQQKLADMLVETDIRRYRLFHQLRHGKLRVGGEDGAQILV